MLETLLLKSTLGRQRDGLIVTIYLPKDSMYRYQDTVDSGSVVCKLGVRLSPVQRNVRTFY